MLIARVSRQGLLVSWSCRACALVKCKSNSWDQNGSTTLSPINMMIKKWFHDRGQPLAYVCSKRMITHGKWKFNLILLAHWWRTFSDAICTQLPTRNAPKRREVLGKWHTRRKRLNNGKKDSVAHKTVMSLSFWCSRLGKGLRTENTWETSICKFKNDFNFHL